ncbi:toxin glutamine deamidase domain-containing protein [Yersinia kristensenii]|uniref:toxin glutamine deamidase domain-containing protein n=1 Tax=Yersinia kristensenii TaxID=28152 RepID=UPI0011A9A500|nr:toxin glutamine deamidase domain-containing protein [Yersinia kristensenii]
MYTSGISSTSLIDNPDLDSSSPPLRALSKGSIESLHSNASIICEPDEWDTASAVITESYTPPKIINRQVENALKPQNYPVDKNRESPLGLENYLSGYLLNKVNYEGKAPVWLRPLAALLALFGIHGFGQTNCASCATAVIDTLEQNKLHLALPYLRGGDVKGNMDRLIYEKKSVTELMTKLHGYQRDEALYGVLVIKRPALWSILPWMTEGHACNVIKFEGSNFIHFLDTQKRTYIKYDLTLYKEEEIADCEEKIRLSSQIRQKAQINKFFGSVGTDGIDVYEKIFKHPENKKAGASSAPA